MDGQVIDRGNGAITQNIALANCQYMLNTIYLHNYLNEYS